MIHSYCRVHVFHLKIFGWVLDPMHILDGAIKHALKWILGIGAKKAGRLNAATMKTINEYMEAWKAPKEMARDVRNFQHLDGWKMRESHEFLVYHLPGLLTIPGISEAIGYQLSQALLALSAGVHLIGGYSHDCPSKVSLIHLSWIVSLCTKWKLMAII